MLVQIKSRVLIVPLVPSIRLLLTSNTIPLGAVNLISAPTFAYFKLLVAKSPILSGASTSFLKYPVQVPLVEVVRFQEGFRLVTLIPP